MVFFPWSNFYVMIFFKPNKIKTNLQRFWALYNNHTGCPASPDGWCAPPPSRCWCLLAGDFLDGVLSALDGRTSTAEGGGEEAEGRTNRAGWGSTGPHGVATI